MGEKTIFEDYDCYYGGTLISSVLYFPLWRFGVRQMVPVVASSVEKSTHVKSPLSGTFATIATMTLSRGSVFYLSDCGKILLKNQYGLDTVTGSFISSFVVSIFTQFFTHPFGIACLGVQFPQAQTNSVFEFLMEQRRETGFRSLFSGAVQGMVRHVPKYAVVGAVFEALNSDNESLISPYLSSTLSTISALPHPLQSLAKAFTATTAATLLTSPIDAIYLERGIPSIGAIFRPIFPNLLFAGLPLTMALFSMDMLRRWKYEAENETNS